MFNQQRGWKTGRDLAYGILNCMGRHTVTGLLTASGKQFLDWSSTYRLFSQQRVDIDKLFGVVRTNCLKEIPSGHSIVAHMDDTIIKKTGKKIPGTAWRRDPLGPPFHTNFIWGQRFIQLSMALPQCEEGGQSRAIPIDFYHCPSAKKPGKKATQESLRIFNEEKKQLKLSKQGSERINAFRQALNVEGYGEREVLLSVDGSYTNSEVLKNLPNGVTLIGRIRKDTKLYKQPIQQPQLGRKRIYGDQLPTPEQIRQSDQYSWQTVHAWAAGKDHAFKVKVIKDALWRSAGENHKLQLVVIKPLSYRLAKESKILYRDPAFLICTDNKLNIEKLLQAYLWRWEIEVNFRDQKSLLGCGQAQVRNPQSIERLPAFITAVYALLQLSAFRSSKNPNQILLPRPKWYAKKENERYTTGDLINNFKAQAWAKANNLNFSGFVNQECLTRSLRNTSNPLNSAVFYMRN